MSTDLKTRLISMLHGVPGLDKVEALIQEKFASEVPLIREIPQYLFDIGGKRIRPVICLITAQSFSEKITQSVIEVAAGIELIHMATLLHDDIIDHAPLRRNEPSPLSKYGIPNTLLSGDFLLVRAFALCSKLPEVIIEATERACVHLTEGEILEFSVPISEHTLESAIEIARKKTAALFKLATFSAASLNNLPEKAINNLKEFGESLGIAFQILDDVLDIEADEKTLGKRRGTDIFEQKPSAVNLLWLQSGSETAKGLLLRKEAPTDVEVNSALNELRNSIVIEKARALALNYTTHAKNSLKAACELAPHSTQAINNLYSLIDYTVERLG